LAEFFVLLLEIRENEIAKVANTGKINPPNSQFACLKRQNAFSNKSLFSMTVWFHCMLEYALPDSGCLISPFAQRRNSAPSSPLRYVTVSRQNTTPFLSHRIIVHILVKIND
jgi:hypothetical protein